MLQIKEEKTQDNSLVLHLNGSVIIENAEDLKRALLNAMSKETCLMIDVSQVDTIDIYGLQLLCSACRSLIKENKQLTWKNGIPPLLVKIIQESGFARSHGCRVCPEHIHCLWQCSLDNQPEFKEGK